MSIDRSLKQNKQRSSIIIKLFIYFAVFIAFAIITVWIFQVLLLNNFYKTSKTEEMLSTANMLEKSVGTDSIQDVADESASRYLIGSVVYRISDNKIYKISQAQSSGRGIILQLNIDKISELYYDTKANGGEYWKEMHFIIKQSGAMMGATAEVYENKNSTYGNEDIASMIYARIVPSDNGDEYFIILNSELTPLRATVKTLEKQFLWITVILLFGALIISAFVAKNISNPIVRMNSSAKQLAKGDYNIDFTDNEGFREIQELATTLNYAAAELSKTDNLQKELISNVSHDLRTPLTMIIGYSEVMRDIPGENTPENVQIIIDEAKRLSELVNETLNLSKLQANAVKPTLTRFNITEAIRDTKHRYEKLIEKDGYKIEFLADCSVQVIADHTMILQVVYNLINNAVNYTGEDKTVKIIQQVKNDKVRISIIDSGEGIEADKLDKIWDRYYKIDKVHKRATVGTGLGLSIVKNVLLAHAASYGADSKVGEGSVFWFELACATPENNNVEKRVDF